MLRQTLLLTKLQLLNLFGINEVRFTKDKRKKWRFFGLSLAWVFVFAMIILYVGGLVYGLHYLGIGEIVPMYLYTLVSLAMLMLSFFKAGSVLFSMKFYDVMVSLPVSQHAILASRFLSMYVGNLLVSALILVPGMAVHGWFLRPGISFYLISLPVILLTPLLPLTISSILGALIKAISSRMKNKSLMETFLMVLLVVIVLGGSFLFGKQAESLTPEALRQMLSTVTESLGKIFPPSVWYYRALSGELLFLLPLFFLPVTVFGLFLCILGKQHQAICLRLNAVTAKHNYRIKQLESSGILWALCKKEAKMYFSSSIYVSNTIIGYVLVVLLAAGIAIAGLDTMVEGLGMPELLPLAKQLLPFVLAMPLCMMSITSSSISMEGKCFWQFQVLPIRTKDIYDAKLLWNLIVAVPFYAVSVVVLLIFVKPTGLLILHYLLLPLVYLVFDVVLGLFVNLLLPILNWENEVRVVKQSAAVLVSMLVGMISVLIPAGLAVALTLTSQAMPLNLYLFLVEGILCFCTILLYTNITKKKPV